MTLVEPGFARSLSDGRQERFVGGVGVGPFTPGIVSLLASLIGAGQSSDAPASGSSNR